jgi:mitochondrial intermediate peptidase
VLKTFAVDETTGDPIPEKLVKALNASRNMFPATELQRQVRCVPSLSVGFYP